MIKLILKHFFLFCLLLVGSVFYYLTMTAPGLQTDIQILNRILIGKLHIESAQGKLFSDFSLKNIAYKNNSQTVQIQSFTIAWNPVGLLSHKLIIHSIAIDHATVIIPKIPASNPSTENPINYLSYLNNITIQQARFNKILIKLADTEITINGSLEKNWNMQWQANKEFLAISGQITGPFLTPNIKAILHTKKFDLSITGHVAYTQESFSAHFISYLSNLNFLTDYIPQIKEPRGIVQAAIQIDGTLKQPNITASLNLKNGQVRIPKLGIKPHTIFLQGKINTTKQLEFSGNFISGKGRAELAGSVDFNNPDYPLTLHVKGSQLQAVNLPEYNVTISPNITLNFVKRNLKLQGTIQIPSAQITPQNFSSTVTLPSEVVFVGSKKPAELPFTTVLQLTLELGDNIHIAYQNLEANLAGHLQLTQLPGSLINAVGELYTQKGAYTAYGQTLKIQTGRLIYTGGSLMNPGLNIAAVKKLKTISTGGNTSNFSSNTSLMPVYTGTQSVTVGVEVVGTLQHPVFNLISTPAMAQADILSYLVFGFPQSQANGNQYGAILSALSSLNPNTQGIGNFTKNIEQKLGLTQLSVESVQMFNPNATSSSNSVVSTTSFVVGKKLSDNLSIHYSIGLFNPVSILNLRYRLTKHWAIQSETSTLDNGGDVLYTIEQD